LSHVFGLTAFDALESFGLIELWFSYTLTKWSPSALSGRIHQIEPTSAEVENDLKKKKDVHTTRYTGTGTIQDTAGSYICARR
jgi:hypothetical protein